MGSSPRPGAVVRVAADHDGVVPGRPGEGVTVTDVVLDVADDGILGDPAGVTDGRKRKKPKAEIVLRRRRVFLFH